MISLSISHSEPSCYPESMENCAERLDSRAKCRIRYFIVIKWLYLNFHFTQIVSNLLLFYLYVVYLFQHFSFILSNLILLHITNFNCTWLFIYSVAASSSFSKFSCTFTLVLSDSFWTIWNVLQLFYHSLQLWYCSTLLPIHKENRNLPSCSTFHHFYILNWRELAFLSYFRTSQTKTDKLTLLRRKFCSPRGHVTNLSSMSTIALDFDFLLFKNFGRCIA